MPVRSLNSSVLKWPNRSEVTDALATWAGNLRKAHPDIIKIGYFGSYARGDWGVGSDVDLIIVVERSEMPRMNRPSKFPKDALPVPADLLVYTKSEWDELRTSDTKFSLVLANEAVWL